MSDTDLCREQLANGVELSITDETNRYFGDFYRVHLVAICRVVLSDDLLLRAFDDSADRQRLRQVYGEAVELRRILSRMGVAGPEVDSVRQALVEDFLVTARIYMADADFPLSLLRRKLNERKSPQAFYVPTHR